MENLTNTRNTVKEKLSTLQDILRGRCPIDDILGLQALILCFCKEHLFKNGEFCPNPDSPYHEIYNQIWYGFRDIWGTFDNNYLNKVKEVVISLEGEKIAKSDCENVLHSYITSQQVFGKDINTQPQSVTDLGIELLGYLDGHVYNPFAGAASYGVKLKIGDNYIGEEINRHVWAIGALRLMVANCLSANYQLADSAKCALGYSTAEASNTKFRYIITTPPFGQRFGFENITIEEFILYRSEQLLADDGTMVLFASSNFVNKTGRFKTIREKLTESNILDTVIALPKETFQPATSLNSVAIVIKKKRSSSAVKFLDARDCFSKKELDTREILRRLNDPDYFILASIEDIRNADYSWHPAKYEDIINPSSVELGLDSSILLKELLVSTGTSEVALGPCRGINISALSSDPFNFKKDIFDLPVSEPSSVQSNSSELQRLHNFEDTKATLEEQKKNIETEINQLESEIEKCIVQVSEEQFANYQLVLAERSRELQFEKQIISDSLARYEEELKSIDSDYSFVEKLFHSSEREELLQEKENLLLRLSNIEKEEENLEEDVKNKLHISERASAFKREVLSRKLSEQKVALSSIVVKLAETERRLVEIHKEIEVTGRKYIKVNHPAIILGGTKPQLKFLYINASPKEPIFLTSSHCYAFKVDTSIVSLDFLVYQISNLRIKDYGETIPMVKRDEILNSRIGFSSIETQIQYIEQKAIEANPLRQELSALKEKMLSQDKAFKAILGFKQHEMGHYMYNIGGSFNKIYRLLSKEAALSRKDEIVRQMSLIEEYMSNVNDILEHLDDLEQFKEGHPINLHSYLQEYVESNHADNYIIRYEVDKFLMSQEDFRPVTLTTEEALKSVIYNVRSNAERHGFQDDPSRNNYELTIKLSVNFNKEILIIDFINNGTPFIKGTPKEIDDMYASPEGKAGKHANTGKGGAYISEMATFYGGDCHINPDGWNPDFTTIRLTFPIYHD